jgi:hypothetical protein
MGNNPASSVVRTGQRGTPRTVLTAAALLTFMGAMLIIVFGVVATSGVYGSRMAWLLGVALPLLAFTALLSWLALRSSRQDSRPEPGGPPDTRKMLLVTSLVIVGIPLVLALMLLGTYALFFVSHALRLVH